jgi:hypothetical protein
VSNSNFRYRPNVTLRRALATLLEIKKGPWQMFSRASFGFLALTLAAGTAFSQQQQDEAIRGCRAFAALSTSAYYDDIFVNLGRQNRNGNFALTWEAWVGDDRAMTGSCESDPRGTIVRFDRLAEKTGRKPAANAQGAYTQGGGFNQTAAGNQGGFGQPAQAGGGFGGTASATNSGAATLDNAGRGTFNGLGYNNAQLDHAHLVLQNGRATITLSSGFSRLTFQGQVTRQISDREFEITIDASDRGRATGQILLRMTPAHNEAEELVINGSNGRQNFAGKFNQ